jgi:hypothetical protein
VKGVGGSEMARHLCESVAADLSCGKSRFSSVERDQGLDVICEGEEETSSVYVIKPSLPVKDLQVGAVPVKVPEGEQSVSLAVSGVASGEAVLDVLASDKASVFCDSVHCVEEEKEGLRVGGG